MSCTFFFSNFKLSPKKLIAISTQGAHRQNEHDSSTNEEITIACNFKARS
jgi:hypothetical protein